VGRPFFKEATQVKSILDPSFQYTPSLQTDVRKTFDRVRREQDEASRDDVGAPRAVTPITVLRRKAGQSRS
jgi:hypothetical protein